MNNKTDPAHAIRAFWIFGLFALALVLAHPNNAMAQSNVTTSGGTINKIPKWTSATTVGDSVITESSGNVGIGTSTPTALLNLRVSSGDVIQRFTNAGNAGGELDLRYKYESSLHRIGLSDSSGNWLFWTQYASPNTASVGYFPGSIGIGTTSPVVQLDVRGDIFAGLTAAPVGVGLGSNSLFLANDSGNASNSFRFDGFANNLYVIARSGAGSTAGAGIVFRTGPAAGGEFDRVTIDPSGKVGIGTTNPTSLLHVAGSARVTGDMVVDGNIAAKYQDVAEWVPATRAISAGTVVVLDAERSNHVMPSARQYDTRVAGVVSANPGVILGDGGAGKVMVATTGRVRVKVDATLAPIRVGDLLVTSDKEGIAMRSQPLDLGGTPIHRPGTLIGKALEPLDKGVGEILVLLSLQ